MPTLTTSEQEVADFFAHMDDELLQCRITGRHVPPSVMDPRKTVFKKQKDGVFQKVWYCQSCGTEVTEYSAPSGYLDERMGSPTYKWPDGYLLPKALRDVGAAVIRALARREGRRRNQERQRQLERARKASKAGKAGAPPVKLVPATKQATS